MVETFGKTSDGTSARSIANTIVLTKATLTKTGKIFKITARLYQQTTATTLARCAIYDINRNLIAQSDEITLIEIPGGFGGFFLTYDFPINIILEPGEYWLAIWATGEWINTQVMGSENAMTSTYTGAFPTTITSYTSSTRTATIYASYIIQKSHVMPLFLP